MWCHDVKSWAVCTKLNVRVTHARTYTHTHTYTHTRKDTFTLLPFQKFVILRMHTNSESNFMKILRMCDLIRRMCDLVWVNVATPFFRNSVIMPPIYRNSENPRFDIGDVKALIAADPADKSVQVCVCMWV